MREEEMARKRADFEAAFEPHFDALYYAPEGETRIAERSLPCRTSIA